MATQIHSSAVVHAGAELAEDVVIGPYCVVGPNVRLGAGVHLRSHVVVDGHTTLGARCEIWPFASVGTKTQDLKFAGGNPRLVIGEKTVVRECATIACATADGCETQVGSSCLIMAYCHIAHDCVVGNRVIMSNAATLAGHVTVEEDCVIGGMTGIHQFVRVGRMAMLGGLSRTVKDVPPYMIAEGSPLQIFGPNKVGLERRGVSEEAQKAIKDAYKIVYRGTLTTSDALKEIEQTLPALPEIKHFVEFIRGSQRGITK